MDAAVAFASLVSGPPSELTLDRACSLMSAAFTGQFEGDAVQRTLDSLAASCRDHDLESVMHVMRQSLVGDRDNYYDRRNSFIDQVLVRGLGLPITLSVIAIEVGRRLDVAVLGVGLPGHFIVREAARDVFGDPFHDGALYDHSGIVSAWPRLVRDEPFDELYLVPISERAILIRMLNNLRALCLRQADPTAMYALATMRGGFVELAHEAPQHAQWVRYLN